MRSGGASAQRVVAGRSAAPDSAAGLNEKCRAGFQGERQCARQSVRLAVVGTGGKPGGEPAKVGGTVTAPATPLVYCRDRRQQLRNRRARLRAQQFACGVLNPLLTNQRRNPVQRSRQA